MQRHQWTFSYPADTLLKAATTKHEFHDQRLGWWTTKKSEVLDKIRAEGLEIDESVAVGYSNKSGRETSVNVRIDLLRDMNECAQKIVEHTAKVKDYDAWIQVLTSQGQTYFSLHQEDWLFFFGK